MERIGRRPGFVLGALIGATGGLVAAAGIFGRDFPLFVLGTFIIGIYAGFAQYYRFAAAGAAIMWLSAFRRAIHSPATTAKVSAGSDPRSL